MTATRSAQKRKAADSKLHRYITVGTRLIPPFISAYSKSHPPITFKHSCISCNDSLTSMTGHMSTSVIPLFTKEGDACNLNLSSHVKTVTQSNWPWISLSIQNNWKNAKNLSHSRIFTEHLQQSPLCAVASEKRKFDTDKNYGETALFGEFSLEFPYEQARHTQST